MKKIARPMSTKQNAAAKPVDPDMTITSITYVNAFLPDPPVNDQDQYDGLTVQIDAPQTNGNGNKEILIFRLRDANSDTEVGVSTTSGTGTFPAPDKANLPLAFPLSPAVNYVLDLVIGKPPVTPATWKDVMATVPVAAGMYTTRNLRFDGEVLSADVKSADAAPQSAVRMNVYTRTGSDYAFVASAFSTDSKISCNLGASYANKALYTTLQSALPADTTQPQLTYITTGPQSALVGVPQPASRITRAQYDGSRLLLAWDLADIADAVKPTFSQVNVFLGSQLLGAYVGAPTSTSFLLNLENAQDVSVTIRTCTDNAVSAPLRKSLISLSTELNRTTVDPLSNIATLSWKSVPGATTYTVEFSDENRVPDLSDTSYTLGAALPQNSVLYYRVIPYDGVTEGPASDWQVIPTQMVEDVDVRYNGVSGIISWEPLANAILYKVFIYEDNVLMTGYPVKTIDDHVEVQLVPVAGKSYSLRVQPSMVAGDGLATGVYNVFDQGIFLSKQAAGTAVPYVYTASSFAELGTASANPAYRVIQLYLPELTSSLGGLGVVPAVAPFSIDKTGDSQLPYVLTIAKADGENADDTDVWLFGSSNLRTPILTAYISFLSELEKQGATPYGISLVQDAIARYMPQTFVETMYYACGLYASSATGSAYIDLRPGMVLRVITTDYVSVNQNSLPNWINGYAGASVMDMPIGSYNTTDAWRVGFDNFFSALSAAGVLNVTTPNAIDFSQDAMAASVDLYYSQFVKPFYRLFIPQNVLSTSGVGSNSTNLNFCLAAASSFGELNFSAPNPAVSPTAYFRGRTTIEVLLTIQVNGNEMCVPVGTTVANILEKYAMRPGFASRAFEHFRMIRSVQGASTQAVPGKDPAVLEIRFDWSGYTTYQYGTGLDVFTLPLMPGDQLFIHI